MSLRPLPISLLGIVVLLALALVPRSAAIAAQDGGPAGYSLTIGASQCDGVTAEATCVPLSGLAVSTESDNGDPSETCVTQPPDDASSSDALCEVMVRFDSSGLVSADLATAPTGYKIVVPSISFSAPAPDEEALNFPDVGFTAVPEDAQVPGLDVESLAIGAVICDDQPGTGTDAAAITCEAFGDATVTVTVTDDAGDVVGSCTLEQFDTPNGGSSASCGVPVPFNATYAVTIDEAAVPDGYVVEENPISFTATDREQGGGDGPDISFALYPDPAGAATTDGDESADPSADASADSSTAPGAAGTGRPAAIFAGDCDTVDVTGDPVADLSETTAPEGDTQGADDASAVETSFTTLDLPLDDILAEDHVLVVFDEDDDTVPLACGTIGGIVTDDGSLAFGLPAGGDSLFFGVAYLTEDGDQTEATIFLAEDLSPNAAPAN